MEYKGGGGGTGSLYEVAGTIWGRKPTHLLHGSKWEKVPGGDRPRQLWVHPLTTDCLNNFQQEQGLSLTLYDPNFQS